MSSDVKVSRTTKRTITLEEHIGTPAFVDGPGSHWKARPEAAPLVKRLCDIGEDRIAEMDAAGIDVQVLSLTAPGVDQMDPAEGTALARDTNDIMGEAVKRYPTRFSGFASLATSAPETAADELERTVREFGFVGGYINGHTRGRYMDDEFFWPILERAEALDVPLYLHPAQPPQAVVEASYTGNFSAEVASRLSMPGWGWHIETSVHILRIILSGAFDRFPRLQFIVGHLGEALPFMLPRICRQFPPEFSKLKHPIGHYFRQNLHYTVSGFNFMSPFVNLLFEIGVSRIMFSADHPFGSMAEAVDFLERMPVSPADREKIAHENAESLMKL